MVQNKKGAGSQDPPFQSLNTIDDHVRFSIKYLIDLLLLYPINSSPVVCIGSNGVEQLTR